MKLLIFFAVSAHAFTSSLPNDRLSRTTVFDGKTNGDLPQPKNEERISFDSLIDMDIVIYKLQDCDDFLLGAVQEDGSLAPLSAWTDEPAFGESIELLVDEEERFSIDVSKIQLHCLVPEANLSYGSRQCHRGVSNPHGEESELLYYVDQSLIDDFGIKFEVKPELEIMW